MEAVKPTGLYAKTESLEDAIAAVIDERQNQDEKWGPAPDNFLDRPDGTSLDDSWAAAWAKARTDAAAKAGELTWRLILAEEAAEAFAEVEPELLRAELIQVAAVAVAWAETIDARTT